MVGEALPINLHILKFSARHGLELGLASLGCRGPIDGHEEHHGHDVHPVLGQETAVVGNLNKIQIKIKVL